MEDRFGVFGMWQSVADGDRDGLKPAESQWDTQAPVGVAAWEAVVVVVCAPAFGSCDKSRPVEEYTDYTRMVTCLIGIGLN